MFTVWNTICLIRENNFNEPRLQLCTVCSLVLRQNMSNYKFKGHFPLLFCYVVNMFRTQL